MANSRPIIELNKNKDEASSKIEVIKNLIFGETIEQHESELEKLKEDLQSQKQELQELISTLRKEMTATIDTKEAEQQKLIKALETKITNEMVDRETMGTLLMDMGKSLLKK
jgi:tRNA U34 5-carboxymethylaminomethyl modifying GTPase MnmE/TrmE